MPNYFGGAPTAFQGGIAAVGEERNRRRRENALSALIDRFGPEAAAPQELGVLEGLAQRREMQPLVMEEATRANEAGRAMAERYGPIAGDPASHATDTSLRQRAMQNAALFLQGATRRGIDPGQAFDRVVPVLRGLNVPAEELAFMRQQVVEDPETVGDLIAMFRGVEGGKALSGGQPMYNDQTGKLEWVIPTEAGPQTLEGYTPATALHAAERVSQGNVRLGLTSREISRKEAQDAGFDAPPGYQLWWDGESGRIIADPIPGGGAEAEREVETGKAIGELSDAIQGAEATVLAPAAAVQRNGEDALRYMQESRWFDEGGILSANVRAGQSKVRGSTAWEVEQMLETMKANIGFAQLSNMSRGLGAVSERELKQLESVLGRLDVARDPNLLQRDIERVLDMHADIVEKVRIAIERRQAEIGRTQQRRDSRYGPPVPARPGAAAEPSIDDLLQQYGQ